LTKCQAKWKTIPLKMKHHLQARAQRQTAVRLRALEGDRAHARAALALLQDRAAALHVEQGLLNNLDMCRFTMNDFQKLDAMLSSGVYSAPVVQAWVGQAVEGPAGLQQHQRLALEQFAAEPMAKRQPEWMKLICQNRDAFRDCIIRRQGATDGSAQLFLFATQQPLQAHALRLRACLGAASPMASGFVALDDVCSVYAHNYTCEGERCYVDMVDAWPEGTTGEDLEVIPRASCTGQGRVVSDSDPIAFADFTHNFAVPAGTRHGARGLRIPADTLDKFPWVQDVLHGSSGHEAHCSHGEGAPGSSGAVAVAGLEPTDAELEDAWQALMAKREDVETLKQDADANFVVSVRGG
jgi:hypothetical protein